MAGKTAIAEAPSCPSCGGEMEERANQWGAFWGCVEYPECGGLVRIGGARKKTRREEIADGARRNRTLTPSQARELQRHDDEQPGLPLLGAGPVELRVAVVEAANALARALAALGG